MRMLHRVALIGQDVMRRRLDRSSVLDSKVASSCEAKGRWIDVEKVVLGVADGRTWESGLRQESKREQSARHEGEAELEAREGQMGLRVCESWVRLEVTETDQQSPNLRPSLPSLVATRPRLSIISIYSIIRASA